jgi:hypothetical protein
MDEESNKPSHSPLMSQPPPGFKRPAKPEPAELPPARDPAEEASSTGAGHGWRGILAPQPAQVVIQQQHQQSQQASALQRTADAAFGSVAALDAETQLSLERHALALAATGLALWRHCKEQAPFHDPDQFRAWLATADTDLKAIAATLAARPAAAAPPSTTLVDQIHDSQMLAVAAERTPRRWVDDYWKRLGTTPDDRRPGVFLSYAHADVREARELKTALGPEVLVVLDADYLRLGETWWDVIGDAITHCALTLVLVSPAAVDSMNVEDEISAAVHERNKTRGRHRLVPVILVAVERMPMPLQGKNGLYVAREGGIQPVARKLKAELTG